MIPSLHNPHITKRTQMYQKKKQKYSWGAGMLEEFLSLPFGRKTVMISSFISCLALFAPWFYEGIQGFNAFQKISAFGFCIAITAFIPLWITLRECFGKKGYIANISHHTILILTLSLGLYTVILHTFALSEILNYNSRSDLGMGGMLSFMSFGISLGGALLSRSFFPQAKETQLMDTPDKVDTSKASLNMEKQHLFNDYE